MPIEINTPDNLQYQFHPAEGYCFTFKVRAANDAHLALCSTPNEADPMYEVFIGGWSNAKSVIRKNRQKPDVVEVDTPGILSPGEFRGFWIRWYDNCITVGQEGEAAAFMTYDAQNLHPINFIGVCTGWGANGTWLLQDDQVVETSDCLSYNFLPLDTGTAIIEFKGKSNCHIGLMSSRSENFPICEVILGGWDNTKSVIRVNRKEPDLIKINTPGIVSEREFRKFFLFWKNGNLVIKTNDIHGQTIMEGINCVDFPVRFIAVRTGWGSTGQWRLETKMPKEAQNSPVAASYTSSAAAAQPGWSAPTPGQGPGCWVPASNGNVPPGAMEGGFDGEQLYIARARHEGGLIPGKLVPSHGVCYVAWGGAEHPVSDYECLCSGSGYWIPITGGNIPPNAMPAGESEAGEPLFIGRAQHNGTVTVGKVQPSHGACYIPYGGQELAFTDFELFVAN